MQYLGYSLDVLRMAILLEHILLWHNPLVCYRAGLGSMVAEDMKIPNRFVGLSKWVVDAISALSFEFQVFHQKNLIELHAIIYFVSTFTWMSLAL